MDKLQSFVTNGDLSIRLMRDEMSDYKLMSKWLTDERVLEFYEGRDNPFNMKKIEEKYSPRMLGEENVVPCLIIYQDNPVGYVQYYPLDGAGCAEYGIETEEGVYGVDLFIGEPNLWNHSIGTRALSALIDYIFDSLGARKTVIDPQVSNHRAIRSYEKVGFTKVKVLPKHELHEGEYRDAWLMMVDRERES